MIDEILPTNKETLKLFAWILAILAGVYIVGWKATLITAVIIVIALALFLFVLFKYFVEWDGRTYKDLE